MVEFLATRMGFTIFTIEANMPEAHRLNDYVLNGTGDPRALLRGMYFWTWQTDEVLAMIEWMRAFNESGKGRIEFTGFDMQTPTVAAEIVRTYVAQHDPPYLQTLDPIWQDVARAQPSTGGAFGVGTATFPVAIAAGHTITFSGYIRTEHVTRGFAGLWWRVDGEKGDDGRPKMLGFDNMADRGPRGTTPWTRYEIEMPVPSGATNINFGVLHPGNGSAWFDSLAVEIDGVPYRDTSAIDLEFESESPRGFYTGGQGYQVGIDKAVSHTGKQSLRSTSVEDSAGQSAPDPKQLAASCSEVVQHLERRRPGVGSDTQGLKELEWVIQNARVVLQYTQLTAGIRTRDESMADNIRWIADQNPGARLIVWAHNGHIAHGGPPGYTPMGAHLRQAFGARYVNFGFAFNQGSFRAVEMGKGLHDFTVGPAPDGSLDATLAAAGLPVMALDLRQGPKPPAVADWLTAAHQTRSIGAVYSDEQAANYFFSASAPDLFDALLFVEKTSAARGIAP
jgi:erythromycin esterase-like protein